MKKKKILLIIIIIIIISLLVFILRNKEQSKTEDSYDFKIYFFNAGKADAILVSKNDKYIMIDTGEESLTEEILNYFQENNITELEYLIITHFDKDHVGSASNIINSINIKNILQTNTTKDSTYYSNYIESLKNKNITPITVSGNYEILLKKLNINIDGPTELYEKNESNNSSLIVSIKNENNSFLFMGDSENQRIKDFVKTNTQKYDFVKIPYHGNYLKRLDSLLEDIKTKFAVMTCSVAEGCEEDTKEVLDKYNIEYYMTKNGSITILSNGSDIKIKQ